MVTFTDFTRKDSVIHTFRSPAITLAAINIIVFISIRITALWNRVDPLLNTFAINTSVDITDTPWSFLTYMFIHIDFTHLFFNVAVLVTAGLIIGRLNPRIAYVIYLTYIAGAVFGAITFRCIADTRAVLIGASCGVMAIVGVMCTTSFKRRGYIPFIGIVNFAIITAVLTILHIGCLIPFNPAVGLAHTAGFVTGCASGIYIYKYMSRRECVTAKNDDILRINTKVRNSGYSSLTPGERSIIENGTKNHK